MYSKFMVEKNLNTDRQNGNLLSHKPAKTRLTSLCAFFHNTSRLRHGSAFVCCFAFPSKLNTYVAYSQIIFTKLATRNRRLPHAPFHFPLLGCNHIFVPLVSFCCYLSISRQHFYTMLLVGFLVLDTIN